MKRLVIVSKVCICMLLASYSYGDDIYVSCRGGNSSIVKLDASGNKTTFATGYSGDMFHGIAFDSGGNLYVSNYDTVTKYSSAGARSTFATGLSRPLGIAVDTAKNVYVGCQTSIKKYGVTGNSVPFSATAIYGPFDFAFDRSGNMYVDNNYNKIYKFDATGNQTTFVWLSNSCSAITVDGSGNLYTVMNSGGGWIDKYDPQGNRSTFASGLSGGLFDATFDSVGNFYVSCWTKGTILKKDLSGNWSTFATGLDQPTYFATQVPEPCTLLLLGVGGLLIRKR